MSMLDLALFYDPGNWTRLFWEYGKGYTIVKDRHIGTDITTRGVAKPIPALLPGPIVDWADTPNIGRVYIQDVSESGSEFKYLSYCHASRYDAPRMGQYLYQGDTFGRIATGPKSVGFGHANYPGSSWTGAHLHLVWHNKPFGAYMLGQNDRYGNPEDLIRWVLSTPAGLDTKPFNPNPTTPPEEDDMFTDADRATLDILKTVVGRTAAPTIPILVQTADTSDGRVFLLMETGQIRHIGPTEKSVYVKRAQALGYAPADFDRLFVHRIGNIGRFPNYIAPN